MSLEFAVMHPEPTKPSRTPPLPRALTADERDDLGRRLVVGQGDIVIRKGAEPASDDHRGGPALGQRPTD